MANFEDFGLRPGIVQTTLPSLSNDQIHELVLDESGRLIIASRFVMGTDSYAAGDSAFSIAAVRADADGPLTGIADGEYSPLQVDANGRLKVTTVVSVDPSDAEYVHGSTFTSGTDAGIFVLATKQTTLAADTNVTDGEYAQFKVNNLGELYTTDASANATLSTISGNIATINTNLGLLTKAEDSLHSSGDAGTMALAVRKDADGAITSADNYAPLQVDASGFLKVIVKGTVDVALTPNGTEAYTISDALAAAGDGLIAITAAGTPFIDVATVAVGAGQTAYVYGWQFACDQNCAARIITDDGTDEIVYKIDVNSSSIPGRSEHWSEGGRIEVPGSATTNLVLQVRKRSATGGNANGTGSLHVRIV